MIVTYWVVICGRRSNVEGKNISVVLGRYHFSASRNGKLGRIAADGTDLLEIRGFSFWTLNPFSLFTSRVQLRWTDMQTMVYTDAPVKGGANYMEPIQSSPSVRAPRPFSFPAPRTTYLP